MGGRTEDRARYYSVRPAGNWTAKCVSDLLGVDDDVSALKHYRQHPECENPAALSGIGSHLVGAPSHIENRFCGRQGPPVGTRQTAMFHRR